MPSLGRVDPFEVGLWSRVMRTGRRGFTLIEIMIVISIVAIIVAAGVPGLFRTIEKDALRKAVSDIVEGCSHARAQAILHGRPSEFIIRAEDGQLLVPKSKGSPEKETSGQTEGSDIFSEHLHEDVAVELIDVNFRDQMQEPEARVHFYPNGTSDEFTIVVSSVEGSFKISVDVVTGLASSQRLR